jgi:hypothetical protein
LAALSDKVPVLSTPNGALHSTNTMLRFLARGHQTLYGASENEVNDVDDWLDWSALELEPSLC